MKMESKVAPIKDDFKFFVEIDINKASKGEDGEWYLEGLAGDTETRDGEGENLNYDAFDIQRMYYVNWEHGKNPEDVIGVIVKKAIKKGKIWLKVKLLKELEKAKNVWLLAKSLAGEGFNLGFSVEGKVLERDPINESIVKRAELYGVALCKVPVNPVTYADIVKSFDFSSSKKENDSEDEDEDENEEKIDKTMNTGNTGMLNPESVEGTPRKNTEEELKELSKSEVYIEIFNKFTKNSELADEFYELIKSINPMVTKDTIEKAKEILGLAQESTEKVEKSEKTEEVKSTEEVEKSEKADMTPGNEANGGKIEELKKGVEKAYDDYVSKKEEYEKVCKSTGVDPEYSKDEMVKSVDSGKLEDILKSQIDTISKSLEIKTSAIGQLLTSNEEARAASVEGLTEKLQKSEEIIQDLQNFNSQLNKRLKIVEETPIRKSVTAESYKERFEKSEEGSKIFSLSDKKSKESLISEINERFGDMEKSENVKMLEVAAQVEMSGSMTPQAQSLLKSQGIEVVA